MHDQVSCRDLTLHDPIGSARTIDFDPAGGAEWLAYGASQLNWIDEHVAPEDLAYGIPDHDPALFVEAWEATLDVRAEIRAKGEADANPFLDRMLEVRSAGFLHEYVWSEYLGFLEPPAELAPRVEEFARWRERSIPAHRHEVHAGADFAARSDQPTVASPRRSSTRLRAYTTQPKAWPSTKTGSLRWIA